MLVQGQQKCININFRLTENLLPILIHRVIANDATTGNMFFCADKFFLLIYLLKTTAALQPPKPEAVFTHV